MPPTAESQAVEGRIQGRVQGVSFRATMQFEARRLGLCGWVKNCRDGAVEFLAQGKPDDVAMLLNWARRGPPGAQVDNIDLREIPAQAALAHFEVRV